MPRILNRFRLKTRKSIGTRPHPLVIRVVDRDPTTCRAFAAAFNDFNYVGVHEGDLLDSEADAIVSPANSFGDMSGGVDRAIDEFFEGEAQRRTQRGIRDQFFGEAPVGHAMIFAMNSRRFPYLIVAPTMRIPGLAAETINAYLAMRAVLVRVMKHNQMSERPIGSIGVTAFCTGTGGMAAAESAEQMRTAIIQVLEDRWQEVTHPMLAPYQVR